MRNRIPALEVHRQMRLPTSEHTSRPWRIHEVTRDFQVEDVWALRTPGGPGELPRLMAQMESGDFPGDAPRVVAALTEVRLKIGRLLGWDGREAGANDGVASLRDRLPADLRSAPAGPDFAPLSSVFLLDDEFAAEMATRVVHAVMHISWVATRTVVTAVKWRFLPSPADGSGRLT